jgi:hypothetical protein
VQYLIVILYKSSRITYFVLAIALQQQITCLASCGGNIAVCIKK